MTNILRAAVPLATMLFVPFTAVEAKEPAPHITVIAPTEHDVRTWSDRVSQAIGRKMRFPLTISTSPYDEGVVELTFECDTAGNPTNVAVVHSSGSRPLDRAAVAAVKRVRSLRPLPAGMNQEQVYKAQRLFVIDDGTERWKKRVAAFLDKGDRSTTGLVRSPGGSATAAIVTLTPAGAP